MAVSTDDPVLESFRELGEVNIQSELVYGHLPVEWRPLEHFICQVYSAKGPLSLPDFRWEMFRSKNLEGEMLSPTIPSLFPHIMMSNYMSMVD